MKNSKSINPLPFVYYYVPVVLLTIVGLIDSIYLSISHFRVYTDIGYKSFCAVSKSFNCDTVSQSAYSVFLDIPVPVWGIIGYLFFIIVLLAANKTESQNKFLWGILFFIAFVFSLCSFILAFISIYLIRSYCIMCMVSFAVNFLLLFYTWLVCRRFRPGNLLQCVKSDIIYLFKGKKLALSLLLAFCVMAASGFLLPEYWEVEVKTAPADVAKGMTKDGHPWIGAEYPELTITEFTDYRCFQCKKMHYYLRTLVRANKDKIRLVHRHYPMDSEFNSVVVNKPLHEGSGELSLIAVYASLKGSFWKMNDILFALPRDIKSVDLRRIAEQAGMNRKNLAAAVRNEKIRKILSRDIWEGMKLRINGTPSYVIDGKVYKGTIPAHILKKYLRKDR